MTSIRMAEHGALERKISKWLVSDGFTVEKQPNEEKVDFSLSVVNVFALQINIGIIKLKLFDRIRVSSNLIFPEDARTAFKKANPTKLEQQKVIQGLHRELLKFGIDHSVKLDLSEILLFKEGYIENLTRPKLMDMMKEIRNVLLYLRSVFSEKFGNISESKPSTEFKMYS